MNYGKAKASIKALVNRKDITDDLAGFFITSALTRVSRLVKTPAQERLTVTLVDAAGTIKVPTDLMSVKSLLVDDYKLTRVPEDHLARYKYDPKPAVYARVGPRWYIKPSPAEGSEVTVWYYGAPAPLMAETDHDPLLSLAPDVVLHAAAVNACKHFVDNERISTFEQLYQSTLQELIDHWHNYDVTEGPMTVGNAYSDLDY